MIKGGRKDHLILLRLDIKKEDMNGFEVDGLITRVLSKTHLIGNGSNDVTFSETGNSTTNGNNDGKYCLQRINTQDSIELDESPFVSEIFVKHPDEDNDSGNPLGGFLCSGYRSDGTFLHAFCTLEKGGILAKDLVIKDKDILVSVNGQMTLGSFKYDHQGVLSLFWTLPLSTKISMVKYNRKSETFSTMEFLLEWKKEDIIVKENSVKLMSQPPTVDALMFPRGFTSLAYQNGKLTLRKSANVMSDCAHHFIVRKTLDEGLYLVYTFQVQKDKSKFLGLNGTKLDIIDGTKDANLKKFRSEVIGRDIYLKPNGKDDMFVYYNTTKRDFELVTRTEALKEEGFGFYILSTLCQP